uniref:Acetyltransf_18 domain-containing protein n=1 Tax=Angiostrongylus cantonensis TaxID=6313 RepID=A0A0K0D363_ANGCA
MRPECVVAVPETLVPRSDFAASTADVRQFVLGQDCASRMNSDEDFVYAAPLKYKAEICSGCDRAIHERTLLTVNGRYIGVTTKLLSDNGIERVMYKKCTRLARRIARHYELHGTTQFQFNKLGAGLTRFLPGLLIRPCHSSKEATIDARVAEQCLSSAKRPCFHHIGIETMLTIGLVVSGILNGNVDILLHCDAFGTNQ